MKRLLFVLPAVAMLAPLPAQKNSDCANPQATNRASPSAHYCFTTLDESELIQVTPGPMVFRLNCDVSGTNTGAEVLVFRCDGHSFSDPNDPTERANNCTADIFDMNGDGVLDSATDEFNCTSDGHHLYELDWYGATHIFVAPQAVSAGGATARFTIRGR